MLLLKESLQHKTHKNLWKESLIIYMSKYAHLSPQKGCMYACSVAKSYLILCNPMDCNPPVSSVHGIFQARILEWVAIFSSTGSSQPRGRTCVSCTGKWILYHRAKEVPTERLETQKMEKKNAFYKLLTFIISSGNNIKGLSFSTKVRCRFKLDHLVINFTSTIYLHRLPKY